MTSLSEQPITELRRRAVELRRMALSATTEEVQAALLALAVRFDALADKRSADCGERSDC